MRAGFIGFVPVPAEDATYTYRYSTVPATISSLSDILTLPNGSYYAIKDFMLSRAYAKLQNMAMSQFYTASFKDNINRMKINAVTRDDAELAAW